MERLCFFYFIFLLKFQHVLFVRSFCCCARREWGEVKQQWTRPLSSFSGCYLLCVTSSLSRPFYVRHSGRYVGKTSVIKLGVGCNHCNHWSYLTRSNAYLMWFIVPHYIVMHHSLLHPEHLLSTHQGEISDLPRFCLFYISFGLEVIALALSTVADISPEDEELVKRVRICTHGSIISYCGIHNKVENIIHTIGLLIWNCLYPQNPEAGAVFFSRITFNWFNRWVKSCYIVNPPHMYRLWLSSSPHPTSMVVKGYKRPLVQEDMWDLNEIDSTAYINQRFQYFMQPELAAARVRYQKQMKKKQEKNKDKAQDAAFQNGLSNGLGKGVSQDVLMMVRMWKMDFIFNK